MYVFIATSDRYTASLPRLPVRLLYWEEYERITDAFHREKQVQGWGRAKRLALVKERGEILPKLSRKKWTGTADE